MEKNWGDTPSATLKTPLCRISPRGVSLPCSPPRLGDFGPPSLPTPLHARLGGGENSGGAPDLDRLRY